ncbi:MAG: ABC transporter permease [Bacilli bacterium]|nr:ABC transporter permease [Bacilli bacterium]
MNNIFHILKKELLELFRDKKSLSMMLVIPIMIPLIVIGMSALFDSEQNKPVEDYNKIGFNYELTEVEKQLAKELKIEVVSKSNDELIKDYENGNIDLYVTRENNIYTLNSDDSITASYASSLVHTYFETYKEYLQRNYLESNSINSNDILNIITVKDNVTVEENFAANYMVNYAFLFILMAVTISATYPATDTTAGERERGTLETLFTFPIKSRDIIVGKFLSVSISSMITGLLSLVLAIISLAVAQDMFDIYKDVELMLSSTEIIYAVVVIVAYSFMISGLCIAIAGKAKTFKEAQSALSPLTFISMFPGMIAFITEMKSSYLLSIVPFMNFSLLFNDITNGNIDIISIILMMISTIIIIVVVLTIIIKQYKSEKVLFTS